MHDLPHRRTGELRTLPAAVPVVSPPDGLYRRVLAELRRWDPAAVTVRQAPAASDYAAACMTIGNPDRLAHLSLRLAVPDGEGHPPTAGGGTLIGRYEPITAARQQRVEPIPVECDDPAPALPAADDDLLDKFYVHLDHGCPGGDVLLAEIQRRGLVC